MASFVEKDQKHVTGYPPKDYPLPQPPEPGYPHHGYPSGPYPHGYPNNLPPHHPSYPYHHSSYFSYSPSHVYQEQKNGYTFARVMFMVMIVLIVGTSTMSLITWLVFGSDIPVFHVDSFNMPLFNVTDDITTKAKWETILTVKNPNHKLQVTFDNIETTLIYKDYLMDTSIASPFSLENDEKKVMNTTFEVPRLGRNMTGTSWVKEMQNEQIKGLVSFDVSIALSAVFRSNAVSYKKTTMRIFCEDLEVAFRNGPTGGGVWNGGNLKDCLVVT